MTIYAKDLENMVYDCISEKLADLKNTRHTAVKTDAAELNDLKLKIKAIEKSEKQLMDTILTGGFRSSVYSREQRAK